MAFLTDLIERAVNRLLMLGLLSLTAPLGSMSAEDRTMPTSPWDDPEFKMAV